MAEFKPWSMPYGAGLEAILDVAFSHTAGQTSGPDTLPAIPYLRGHRGLENPTFCRLAPPAAVTPSTPRICRPWGLSWTRRGTGLPVCASTASDSTWPRPRPDKKAASTRSPSSLTSSPRTRGVSGRAVAEPWDVGQIYSYDWSRTRSG